jgi:hypothetical protein
MTDKDYGRLTEFINEGTGCLVPYNQSSRDLTDTAKSGEIITLLEMTDRSLSFHRCYFSLLGFIYDQLPKRFHQKLAKKHFHTYLKHLKGNFNIVAQFGDIVLVEYDSISFSRMSQNQFKDYIRDMLPWIYLKVIGKYYKVGGWRYNRKINDIETEYIKFLSKL